ncbi:Lamin-C [Orchesella cincta]|uniref:Lamin-C n=1 Tax=Orchesella cincta TaxID=48709 RepID=A0A1D2MWF5_ORCCI|nr:Lamin-C [Orchesella cincta]
MATKSSSSRSKFDSSSSLGSNGYGSGSPTSPERPKTPTMRSRIDEKNALIGLNNRLANILQRKQELEDENNLLSRELQAERENTIKTLTRLQVTYDGELEGIRKALEDSDKDKARLELSNVKLTKEVDDMRNKYDKKVNELPVLQNKLAQAKAQVDKLTSDLQKAHDDKERLAREKSAFGGREKIEMQSHVKGQAEEFAVRTQIFEQEIVNIKKHREIEIEEMDSRLQKKYESQLENDIQQLRDEFERKAQASREAQENLFNAKESDMKGQIKRLKDLISSKGHELSAMQSKMDTISQKLSALEGEKFGYQQIIRDLQKKIQEDEEAFEQEKHRLERENDDLRSRMENLIKEYQDLWETKTALDQEIATYHMLLEGEERRLNQMENSPRQQKTTTTTRESTSTSKTSASFTVV